MPQVIDTISELREVLSKHRCVPGKRLGFVPTMGYLHEGHATLARRAREQCAVVVVSIFVNPTQFGPKEDFSSYPRDFERDLEILANEGTDIVFAPSASEIYPQGFSTTIKAGDISRSLEGEYRPGHFDGVTTVVAKLFNIVQPNAAYFGEKDWQQLQVIKAMVRDLDMPTEIVGVPVVREHDGLAMSSRNVRLDSAERASALCLYRALMAAQRAFAAGERSAAQLEVLMRAELASEPLARVDYAVVRDAETLEPISTATTSSRTLIAARIRAVRLTDTHTLQDQPAS